RSNTVSVFSITKKYQYILVLNSRSPALRSRDVRRALNLAVDRAKLVRDGLHGHGVPSSSPMWPHYWPLPAPSERTAYDARKAAAILAAGRKGAAGPALRFTCLVVPDSVNERIALEVKRQLEAVGVEMIVQGASQDEIYKAEQSRSFDAVM